MPARQPILCAGAALWDVIGRTATPLPHGADVPGRIDRRAGGVALNIALALAGRGHPVALLAAVGRDAAGDDLVARIETAGIGIAGVHRHPGATDTYLAIEDARGELHAAVADCAGLERAGPALLDALRDGRLAAPWPGRIVADGNLPGPVLAALMADPATAERATRPGARQLRQGRRPRPPPPRPSRRALSQPHRGGAGLRRRLP